MVPVDPAQYMCDSVKEGPLGNRACSLTTGAVTKGSGCPQAFWNFRKLIPPQNSLTQSSFVQLRQIFQIFLLCASTVTPR